MVDVLMLESLGNTDPYRLLNITREYDRTEDPDLQQSFFTKRSIFEASAYTQRDGSGNETAFLGHVTLQSNGDLGFDPSVVFAGDVGGQGIREFFAAEIAQHRDGPTIWSDLLSGDDVIFGNGYVYDLAGYGGDDVILNAYPAGQGNGAAISGGEGNDILFTGNTRTISGGGGKDTFVADARDWNVLDFVHGKDRLLFDGSVYAELGTKITDKNFVFGPAAVDADDRLIISRYNNHYLGVFIDPDGSGLQSQVPVGSIDSRKDLTARDFGVVDAGTLIPDIFGDAGKPGVVPMGHAALYMPFGHADVFLAHHGVVQLA